MPTHTPLLRLPPELHLQIASHLTTIFDVYDFSLTSRQLYRTVYPLIWSARDRITNHLQYALHAEYSSGLDNTHGFFSLALDPSPPHPTLTIIGHPASVLALQFALDDPIPAGLITHMVLSVGALTADEAHWAQEACLPNTDDTHEAFRRKELADALEEVNTRLRSRGIWELDATWEGYTEENVPSAAPLNPQFAGSRVEEIDPPPAWHIPLSTMCLHGSLFPRLEEVTIQMPYYICRTRMKEVNAALTTILANPQNLPRLKKMKLMQSWVSISVLDRLSTKRKRLETVRCSVDLQGSNYPTVFHLHYSSITSLSVRLSGSDVKFLLSNLPHALKTLVVELIGHTPDRFRVKMWGICRALKTVKKTLEVLRLDWLMDDVHTSEWREYPEVVLFSGRPPSWEEFVALREMVMPLWAVSGGHPSLQIKTEHILPKGVKILEVTLGMQGYMHRPLRGRLAEMLLNAITEMVGGLVNVKKRGLLPVVEQVHMDFGLVSLIHNRVMSGQMYTGVFQDAADASIEILNVEEIVDALKAGGGRPQGLRKPYPPFRVRSHRNDPW